MKMTDPQPNTIIGRAIAHESAHLHVTGQAIYVDDIPEARNCLHAALTLSPHSHAQILGVDLSAVLATPGVVAAFTAQDIPGSKMWGAVTHDDWLLAEQKVEFAGQPVVLVVATSYEIARIAARKAQIQYEKLPAVLSIEQAKAQSSFLGEPVCIEIGNTSEALKRSPRRLRGQAAIGGQEHFYLEGQVALAIPQEDGQMQVWSSSQHPSEMQQTVAHTLGIEQHQVVSLVRRMGGGFGGKEVQPAQFVALAAVAAHRLKQPVKLRLDRDDDMMITGKRHAFAFDYEVGFDESGKLLAFDIELNSNCGYSTDYSHQVNDRALCHLDNAYFHEHLRVLNHRCKTNLQSATAFRGFGAPQGMFAIEHAMETIARATGNDPLDVRKRNLYGPAPRNTTHYGATIEGFHIPAMLEELELSCNYRQRRAEIRAFNQRSPIVKKGIAMTPVMFGVSFNASFLNRGSAVVALYLDGSLMVNHAGTEMGQGLFTKIAQIVANEFDVPVRQVRISATDTSKLPNTSPTAASSGTDLNGMAALNACSQLKARLYGLISKLWKVSESSLYFKAGSIVSTESDRSLTLAELARKANFNRIHLVAHGFYNTPKIHWDGKRFQGQPFYYYAMGVACSEVAIDTLTGEHKFLRADLLHDVGQSLNPAIDIGQIEGGFIQGVGYLTCEELVWDSQGLLRTHAPSTYKIPTAAEIPPVFNVKLYNRVNQEPTIHRSKAVGEPPLMLAMSVWFAIADAISSLSDYRQVAELNAPATPEAIFKACQAMQHSR